jgi:hypothetical protein
MKPINRHQSQLLVRKSYKPNRMIRIRPVKLKFVFQPVRIGLKPQLVLMNTETQSRTMANVAFLD